VSRPRGPLPLVLLSLAIAAVGLTLVLALHRSDVDALTRAPRRATVDPSPCDTTVASVPAARAALATAQPGSSVCLRDGNYDRLDLDAHGKGPGVTVRAENPGRATIAGAVLSGSHLALARFDVIGQITIEPGSRKISVLHNRIRGGYFGIEAGPTTSTSISDTAIRGNKFVGPFGEDAIRLNRYHDSGDADPYGVLIEGNEITNVRENGNHSDCLQSVWGGDDLYFRRNYLHDNRCQGFFVNDQPAPVSNIVVHNNLMLRNAARCDPPSSPCGPPLIFQVFGPTRGISLRDNTIWTPGNGSAVAVREGPFGRIVVVGNVIYRAWSDWSGGFPRFLEGRNTVCQWEGTLPPLSRESKRRCSPRFRDPAHDDYRLRGGAGVDWSPADQRFGP
jgi:hypothetical protein